MKKVSKQILTWFEDNFQDGKIDDSYHKRIVNGVVSSYVTKAKLKEELSNIINSFQQEQPDVDLEKEVKRWKNKHGVVGMDDLWFKFARYFYELGQCNVRKEE